MGACVKGCLASDVPFGKGDEDGFAVAVGCLPEVDQEELDSQEGARPAQARSEPSGRHSKLGSEDIEPHALAMVGDQQGAPLLGNSGQGEAEGGNFLVALEMLPRPLRFTQVGEQVGVATPALLFPELGVEQVASDHRGVGSHLVLAHPMPRLGNPQERLLGQVVDHGWVAHQRLQHTAHAWLQVSQGGSGCLVENLGEAAVSAHKPSSTTDRDTASVL